MDEFDRRYLTVDPVTGHEVYPNWLLPKVAEMNQKLAKYTARLEHKQHQHEQQQQNKLTESPDSGNEDQEGGMAWLVNFDDNLPFLRDHRQRPRSPMRRFSPAGRRPMSP